MDAKKQLTEFKKSLEIELQEYFDLKTEEAAQISPFCKEFIGYVANITMRGGKRIRAAILYYSYLAHGGRDRKRALKAAMAMELAQTFLLIHDDIIDSDDMRRGGMTIHKIYQNLGEKRYPDCNSRNFGNAVAILAGDAACALSNEIISEGGFKPNDAVRALRELNKMYSKEVYGEFLDVLSELRGDIEQKDVILTHQLKTVPYTFDGPLKIGAILAGANDKELERLEKYTTSLGTAFQIQDDILGMFGTEEKLGKSVTSDLREGKRTLLILDAIDKANPDQKAIILSNLGNRRLNLSGLKSVRDVITATGALEKSAKLAEQYVCDAVESLAKLRLKGEGREFLLGIAEYMVKREY